VFATTHSWECIRAAHVSFLSQPVYDFHLLRLDRRDSEVLAVNYDRDTIEASLDGGMEMRG
jgi:hypothetical protein